MTREELALRIILRDDFAANALCGIIAAHAADGCNLPSARRAAAMAYEYADAMLAVRDTNRLSSTVDSPSPSPLSPAAEGGAQ